VYWKGAEEAQSMRKVAEGCRSAMEVQASFWKWSEDCRRELECRDECRKESE